jgi:regulator of protease activity HflC (stomatin/prohibitin superfamily)
MYRYVTVMEYERGLHYRRGRFVGVLGPGRYRLWTAQGRQVVRADMRETALQVTGQEVLTADNVPVRLNILVRFRVQDPARAMHEVTSYTDALHQAAQLAAREMAAPRTVEQMVAERTTLTGELTARIGEAAAGFGVEVVTVAIKDVILDAGLKAVYEAKLAAEQKGQAALIAARHEVAAARALANAAALLAENPALLAQRQLDVLEKAASNGYGNHFVVLPEGLAELVRKLSQP